MKRLDNIDKPNRRPNFTLSEDVDIDKMFRAGGLYRLEEGTDYTGSKSAVENYIRSEWRARYGRCVITEKEKKEKDSFIDVEITPPSLP